MRISGKSVKQSLLMILIGCILANCSNLRNSLSSPEDDELGDQLDSLVEAYNKSEKLYNDKHRSYFSNIYEKLPKKEIPKHSSNLVKSDASSLLSFRKLNAIANNVFNGEDQLKSNSALASTLKSTMNDPSLKIKLRVRAAKLAARLNNVPISLQITSSNVNTKPKNVDSHIIVPRIARLYRPDYYVENYKAGNWEP